VNVLGDKLVGLHDEGEPEEGTRVLGDKLVGLTDEGADVEGPHVLGLIEVGCMLVGCPEVG